MIQDIKKKAISDLQGITSVESLEQWRIEYLGRNSQLTSILRNIRSLPENERKTVGSETNTLKELLQFEYKKFKLNLSKTNTSTNSIDVTLPGRKEMLEDCTQSPRLLEKSLPLLRYGI